MKNIVKWFKILCNINEYCKILKDTLKYIENVENKYLKNDIDYDSFDQKEFDVTTSCKFCKSNFDHVQSCAISIRHFSA